MAQPYGGKKEGHRLPPGWPKPAQGLFGDVIVNIVINKYQEAKQESSAFVELILHCIWKIDPLLHSPAIFSQFPQGETEGQWPRT